MIRKSSVLTVLCRKMVSVKFRRENWKERKKFGANAPMSAAGECFIYGPTTSNSNLKKFQFGE